MAVQRNSGQGMPDAKAGKSVIVAVRRDPLAATLNGERGKERIRHQVSFDVGHGAQPGEDFPMARPRSHHRTVRLLTEFLGEGEGRAHQTGRVEDLRMGHDPEKPAEHKIGKAVGLIGINQILEPREVVAMVQGVLTVGIDEHVDIKKHHQVLPCRPGGTRSRRDLPQDGGPARRPL